MASNIFYDNFDSPPTGQTGTTSVTYDDSENEWYPSSTRYVYSSTASNNTITTSIYPDITPGISVFESTSDGSPFEFLSYAFNTPYPQFISDVVIYFTEPVVNPDAVGIVVTYENGTTYTQNNAYPNRTPSWTVPGNTESITNISFNATFLPEVENEVFSAATLQSSLAVTYLAAQSKISTSQGEKSIEDLQRGDLTLQGKIARVIIQEFPFSTLVELAKIKKGSLGDSLPSRDISLF